MGPKSCQICFTSHWLHSISGFIYFEFDIKFCKKGGKLDNAIETTTTIGKIQNIPNSKNKEIINEFLEYRRNNGSSEHQQNNDLKVVITFGNFIGKDIEFLDINRKEQILEFLNTKVKSYDQDPDKRWITT